MATTDDAAARAIVAGLLKMLAEADGALRTMAEPASDGTQTIFSAEFATEALALGFRDTSAMHCAEAGVRTTTAWYSGDSRRHVHPSAAGKFYVQVTLGGYEFAAEPADEALVGPFDEAPATCICGRDVIVANYSCAECLAEKDAREDARDERRSVRS